MFLDETLGGRMQARRGELVDVLEGEGSVGSLDGRPIGLITWLAASDRLSVEIRAVAVDPRVRGQGMGRALFVAAHERLAAAGARTTWLVTTNDNGPAIRLYESLGYRVVQVRRGAIDDMRRTLKPSIPLVGHAGVEMHDEIELARTIP